MGKTDSNEYYSKILGVDVNSIETVSPLNEISVDPNVHRSKVFSRVVKYKDGNTSSLLYKVMPKPEYKNANHHEEIVLSFAYDLAKKTPNIHYSIPKLLDHIIDERTLVMEYVEGDSLAKRIQTLDKRVDEILNPESEEKIEPAVEKEMERMLHPQEEEEEQEEN